MVSVIRHPKSFDFFISYPGPDIAYAQTLSDALQPLGRIFIAPQSELLGEDWPNRLTTTIRDTWVTLAIISRHTPAAYFQREEILLAVEENRAGFHTVIPIRLALHGETPPLPVGLNLKTVMIFAQDRKKRSTQSLTDCSQPETTSDLALDSDGGQAANAPAHRNCHPPPATRFARR